MNNQCYFCLKVNFLFFVVLVTLSKDVEAQYFEDVTGASIEVILDEYPYQHVRAFDFDRDGDQDLLIFAHTSDPAVEAPSRTSMVYMCENNGGLDFSDAVYLSGTRVSAQDVFFEDVDQDGFLDLIYSGSSFNDLNNSGCYWRPEDSAFADPALWNT
ncbi:MAG: FG-GAP repeat domain-containing protein, partial [Flavobacteriales bacterium]